jgi:hypothetical protein
VKNVPDIAPEVRGLLEEIVADPRSRIRLAPRRALSTWFDAGETARASDITRTKAERHLVEVHREELAALLCEASWISYWKAPILAHRPVGPDGSLYNPTYCEPEWRLRAKREKYSASDASNILRQCLNGIEPHQGERLALASLSLIPRDLARYYFALCVPWDRPRTAIKLLSRLARRALPLSTRGEALLSLASRTCALGMLRAARELYQEFTASSPESPYGRMCSFNLSCFLGDVAEARSEALELSKIVSPHDAVLHEELQLFREWARTRSEEQLAEARRASRSLSGRLPEVATMICRAFES